MLDLWFDSLLKRGSIRLRIISIFVFAILTYAISLAAEHRDHGGDKTHPQLQSIEWLKSQLIKYEEFSWIVDMPLKSDDSIPTFEFSSPSERLYSQKSDQFDQTALSLLALRTFLDGKYEDYLLFVSKQGERDQLTWQSFSSLQSHIRSIIRRHPTINETDLRELFEVELILDKTDRGFDECPSFAKLKPTCQTLLKEITGLAHFGHISHLEGGPNMFHKLKKSEILKNNLIGFEIGFFLHICKVAGAMADIEPCSSVTFNESTCKALNAVKRACMSLKDSSEQDAFDHYLSQRAAWLDFDPNSPLHRVLARLGAMLRLQTPADGKILKEAFLKLPPDQLSVVIDEFNSHGSDLSANTPTYMPAVFVNLLNNGILGKGQKERMIETIQVGLPFVAHVLQAYRSEVAAKKIDPKVILNFDEVAKYVKLSPRQLKSDDFTIQVDGRVLINIH